MLTYYIKAAADNEPNKENRLINQLFKQEQEITQGLNIERLEKGLIAIRSEIIDNEGLIKIIGANIASYIVGEYYHIVTSELIDNECENLGFNDLEKKKIQTQINHTIFKGNSPVNKGLICEVQRRLTDYLKDNSEINIPGFTKFRLKDLLDNIKLIVDGAVSECIIEHEYNEFIGLLRYFVQTQWPKVDEVHIYFKNGEYVLRGDDNKPIDNLFVEELRNDDIEMTKEDMLIGSLITLAPQKIVIHTRNHLKNKEIINTISKVFENQVVLID